MLEFPEKRIKKLGKTEIFRDFTTEEISKLLEDIYYVETKYAAGEFIYLAENKVEYLFILVEGKVESAILSDISKQLVVKEVKTPQLIIPAMVFSDMNNTINVRAIKDSIVIKIKKIHFERKLQMNLKLQKNFLTLLSNRFIMISQKMTFLNFYSIRQKLVCYFLDHLNEANNTSPQKMSITKLADSFGVERSSLSTELSKLEQEGYIQNFLTNRLKSSTQTFSGSF